MDSTKLIVEHKAKGRPKGAVNNPKFALVSLSELNEYLKPNAMIPVKIEFANAVFNSEHEGMEEIDTVATPAPAISVTRHIPNS